MAKKKQSRPQMNWRPTAEDIKLISELKVRTGIQADSEILRLALRQLAINYGATA